MVVCVLWSRWTRNGQQPAEADDCFPSHFSPVTYSAVRTSRSPIGNLGLIMLKLIGLLGHSTAEFLRDHHFNDENGSRAANAASASYAIASNGLCRWRDAQVQAYKTWYAYLSAQAAVGKPAFNARDRIGRGPWQNFRGEVVAQSVGDLHGENNKLNMQMSC